MESQLSLSFVCASLTSLCSTNLPSIEPQAQMATVQLVREGLFEVSWIIVSPGIGRPLVGDTQEVILSGINQICLLTFCPKRDHSETLEVNFFRGNLMKKNCFDTKIVNATCFKKTVADEIQHLEDSKWMCFWDKLNLSMTMLQEKHYHGSCETRLFKIMIEYQRNSTECFNEGQVCVLSHLRNLWENKSLTDVTFKCGDKTIEAHSIIISSASRVFTAIFENGFKESKERVIQVVDIKPEVLEQLLRYTYTGDVDLKTLNVSDLMIAADKYSIDTLKGECAYYLSKKITMDNANLYLVLAHLHQAPILYENVLAFMSKNAQKISTRKDWLQLIKNYPELVFAVVQRMVL